MERTFALIKPDATEYAAHILHAIGRSGLNILIVRPAHFTGELCDLFYEDHVGKDFYPAHRAHMASGYCTGAILSGSDAVARWRALMGATDPKQAEEGTLRARFGTELPRNAVHGSDSVAAACREAALLNFPW